MGRPRRGIGAELFAVALIFGCLAATLAAVIAVHRRQAPRKPSAPAVALPTPVPEVVAKPAPAVVADPAPPPVDPTAKIVAELAAAEAEQRAEAEKAARRIAAVESATKSALAESSRWKRSIALTRGQIAARDTEADRREGEAEMAGFERDALARRLDDVKATLERDRERPGYAVLPHRGPHGTWRRPIVLECRAAGVALRPKGPSFNLLEIASPLGMASGSFVAAVTREAIRVQRRTAADGGEVVPYIFFIVRPDGVRSYYLARTQLERLGIAFGYELADNDWAIDIPDLDDPATWDGSPPPLSTVASLDAPASRRRPGGGTSAPADPDNPFVWPKTPPGVDGRGDGQGVVGLPHSGQGGGPSSMPGGSGDGLGPLGPAGLDPEFAPSPGGAGTLAGTAGRAAVGSGPALGHSEDAWSRTRRPFDPTRPAPLASLARGASGALGGLDAPDGPVPGRPSGRSSPMAGAPGLGGGRPRSGRSGAGASLPAGSVPGSGLGDAQGGSAGSGEGSGSGGGDRDRAGGQSPGLRGGAQDAEGSPSPEATEPGRLGAPGSEATDVASSSPTGSEPPGIDGRQPGNPGSPGAPGSADGRGSGGSGGQASGSASSGGQASTGEGQDGKPGDESGEAGGQPGIKSPIDGPPRPSKPIELVLACGPKGVAVYPGDYRVTKATLKAKDELLVAQLRAIVRRREQAEPSFRPRPSVRYVIEPGGRETYATARGQVALSGLGWPQSSLISGGDSFRLFSTDDW